jgi:uncharacterized protein YceK
MKRLVITLFILGMSGCVTPVSYHIPQTTPQGRVSGGAALTYWGSMGGVSPLPLLAPFIRFGLSENLDFGIGFEGLPIGGLTTIDIKYQFLQGGFDGSIRVGVGGQLTGFVPYASLSFGTKVFYAGFGAQYWGIKGEFFGKAVEMRTIAPQAFLGFMLGGGNLKFVPELNVMMPTSSVTLFGVTATSGAIVYKLGLGLAYIPSK